MQKFEKYRDYSAADFATDLDFMLWVKSADHQSDKFWNEVLEQYPFQSETINKAKRIVHAMKVVTHEIDDDAGQKSWGHIAQNIQQQNNGGEKKRVISMRSWLAAASVIAILTAGYFLFLNKPSEQKVLAKTENKLPVQNDLMPGGNKAILMLDDGSTIVLDSAQNGNLASQGGTKIVKTEDGRLAYEGSNAKAEQQSIQMNTVSTPRGGQYQLTLSDGTKVWLNAASSIRFPASFSGTKREVAITGEAYFEVAHNAKMPFTVTVKNMDVEILGTHFNINAYDDLGNVQTSLFEGSVKIVSGGKNELIIPGQQAIVNNQSNAISVNNHIDAEAILAWKNGKFYFNDANIQSVMNQISRWYDVEVEYEGKINKTFAGTISRNVTASNIFKILEATGGVHFKIEGKKVIVNP